MTITSQSTLCIAWVKVFSFLAEFSHGRLNFLCHFYYEIPFSVPVQSWFFIVNFTLALGIPHNSKFPRYLATQSDPLIQLNISAALYKTAVSPVRLHYFSKPLLWPSSFPGKYYYESTVTDEGLCRVGWSTMKAKLDLGTDQEGFGFGGTGKKSFGRQFDSYGEVGLSCLGLDVSQNCVSNENITFFLTIKFEVF